MGFLKWKQENNSYRINIKEFINSIYLYFILSKHDWSINTRPDIPTIIKVNHPLYFLTRSYIKIT